MAETQVAEQKAVKPLTAGVLDEDMYPTITVADEPPPVAQSATVGQSQPSTPQQLDPNKYVDSPEAGAAVGAFARQAGAAAAQYGAIGAGAYTGTKVGAGVGLVLSGPPAAAVGAVVGLGAGIVSGYLFGEGIKDIFSIPRVADERPEVRPYAVAGETFGTGLPIIAAPLAAARAGIRAGAGRVGKYLDTLIERAARSPSAYASVELQSLTGAAYLGGVAESLDPGNIALRLPAEVVGGVIFPFRWASYGAYTAWDAAKMGLGKMGEAGRMSRAGQIIQTIVENAGDDPHIVAEALRRSGLPGMNLTSAQKTGHPALAAIEAALIKEESKFGEQAAQRAKDGLDAIKGMIMALVQTGDQAAFREAAKLRAGYFRALLASRIGKAETETTTAIRDAEQAAVSAAGEITGDLPKVTAEISKRMGAALEESLSAARTVERALWAEVPRDIPANAQPLIDAFDALRATMLPEHSIPGIAEKFVERLRAQAGRTTSGELISARTDFLELSREAAAGKWEGHRNATRIYSALAENALEAINKNASDPAFARLWGEVKSYDAAREWSRELNDVFTRTFTGNALAPQRFGFDKLSPELLLREAMGTGLEAGALRFRQLEEAAAFIPKMAKEFGARGVTKVLGEEGIAKATANFDAVMDAQERFLRLTAAGAVNPDTGRVSTVALSRIMQDNAELMERFPEAAKSMKEALAVELTAKQTIPLIKKTGSGLLNIYKGAETTIEQQAAFARLVKTESPVDVVGRVLNSDNPLVDFHQMVRLARSAASRPKPYDMPSADALEGLKASVWEFLIRSSTKPDGAVDLVKLKAALDAPIKPRFPSVAQIMERNDLMKPDDLIQVRELFDVMGKINVATATKKAADIGTLSPPQLIELAARIAGAQVGRVIAGATGGGTVQTPGIVAEKAKGVIGQLFAKIPQKNTMTLLVRAANEPEFAAMLLEKPVGPAATFKLGRQMHAYLYASGLLAARDVLEEQAGP